MDTTEQRTRNDRCQSRAGLTLPTVLGVNLLVGISGAIAETYYVPDDFTTIQAAIDAVSDGDEIIVRPGEYNEALDLLGKEILLRGETGGEYLDGNGLGSSIVSASSGETLNTVLRGFRIRNGASVNGGGIRLTNDSALTIQDCQFLWNEAVELGSGIWIDHSTAMLVNCEFRYNDASAIFCASADLSLDHCLFEFNVAASGAAIDARDTTLTIIDSNFWYNGRVGTGGAVSLRRGSLSCRGSDFVGNSTIPNGGGGGMSLADLERAEFVGCLFENNSAGSGGAIRADEVSLDILDCRFVGNDAQDFEGGAIDAEDGDLSIVDSYFSLNTGASYGGAVAVTTGALNELVIDSCRFSENVARSNGGALRVEKGHGGPEPAVIRDCEFNSNFLTLSNSVGGAVYARYDVIVRDCFFDRNVAANGGAAGTSNLVASADEPSFQFCTFVENMATVDGGALYQENSGLWALNCLFRDNVAHEDGGALGIFDGRCVLANSVMTNNTSIGRGGAVYFFGNSAPSLIVSNCTLVNNASLQAGDAVYSFDGQKTLVANSIVRGDAGGHIDQLLNETRVEYCNVEGGHPGEGNIDADPVFLDITENDLRLSNGSPCIDAGNSLLVPDGILVDFLGGARFLDDRGKFDIGIGNPRVVDIGADEFAGISEFSLTITPLPIIAGEPMDVRVNNASPGRKVWFFFALDGLGETIIPPLNVTLDLASARLAGAWETDAEGNLDEAVIVPANVGARAIWLQAAQVGVTSNYVGTRTSRE